jgi:hypothetical protein
MRSPWPIVIALLGLFAVAAWYDDTFAPAGARAPGHAVIPPSR